MATASAADIWDPSPEAWMLGWLDVCLFVCLAADLGFVLITFWRPLTTSGVCCKLLVTFGFHWSSQDVRVMLFDNPVQAGAQI